MRGESFAKGNCAISVPHEVFIYPSLSPLYERETSTVLARVIYRFVTVQEALIVLQRDSCLRERHKAALVLWDWISICGNTKII
jgi:hypothetical protein